MVDVFDYGSLYEGSYELLLVRAGLFLITFILTHLALKKSLDFEKIPSAIISISISILAVGVVDAELLVNYFLPVYGLFGILAVAFIPFFLFFFFIESFDFPLIRKVGFVMIGVFYFFAGYFEMGIFSLGSYWTQDIAWIYYGFAGLSFLVLIFEKSIRKFVFYRK